MVKYLNGTQGTGTDGGTIAEAAELLKNHADYIVRNNFRLIDYTGQCAGRSEVLRVRY